VAGYYEHGNKLWSSVKGQECLDQFSDFQALTKIFAPLSQEERLLLLSRQNFLHSTTNSSQLKSVLTKLGPVYNFTPYLSTII
jgi:hypothetical protein